jgi:hypothetical protein
MRTHTICLALATVLVCPFASAQWVQTNGPYGGQINCLAVSGTNLFSGTQDGGVFLSRYRRQPCSQNRYAHPFDNNSQRDITSSHLRATPMMLIRLLFPLQFRK